MDTGTLNFALKMIKEEFKLSDADILVLSRRMLADDKEFEKIWKIYKNFGGQRYDGSTDRFRELLQELIN